MQTLVQFARMRNASIGDAVSSCAAQTGAMFLDLAEVGLPPSVASGEGFFSSALPPEGKEGVERGREEIQVAGPVRRTARRTSRRTSRRQQIIYE